MSDYLPEGWCRTKLSSIAKVVRGVTYKKADSSPLSSPDRVGLLRATNIDGRALQISDLVYVPREVVSESQLLRTGDVVIASSSGSRDLVGKAGQFVGAPSPISFGAFCTTLRPSSDLHSGYFASYFQSDRYRDAVAASAAGSNINNLKSSLLAEHLFPLPPWAEQARIADKLEELLSDLDAAVAELKTAQKKLAQYRQSLLKAAVEGQLTADWRGRNGEPEESGARLLERILRERRTRWEARELAKFKEEGREPPIGWRTKYVEPEPVSENGMPRLPKDWVWARSEQLCEFITKGTTPPKGQANEEPRSVPFLRVTNLRSDGGLDLEDRVYVSEAVHRGFLARSVVYPGDVLMNIVGPPLGQVSLVPPTFGEWNINQAIAIFRAVEGVSPRFLVNYLLSATAQAWLDARAKTTAGQTNLTLEVCRDLPIALPPYKEQVEVVDRASAALALVVEQQASIAAALRQAAAQRKNILRAAFSGQLVPQDPNDEPASVLLERIRAERAAQGEEGKRRRSPTKKSKAPA